MANAMVMKFGDGEITYDQVVGNSEGTSMLYYLDDEIIGSANDTDGDGEMDLFLTYNADMDVTSEIADTDGDGELDVLSVGQETTTETTKDSLPISVSPDEEGGAPIVWIVAVVVIVAGLAVLKHKK